MCLRLFSVHLYPDLGKFEMVFESRSDFVKLDLISHTRCVFSDIMDHSRLLARVAFDWHCPGDLGLSVGNDVLAGCSR